MANYPKSKNMNTTRRPLPKRSGASLLVAVLCGYALASLYPPQTLTRFVERFFEGGKPLPQVVQVVEEKAELPTPKFEFYTLLTQEKEPVKVKAPRVSVPIKMPESEKVEAVAPAVSPSVASVPASKYTYLVQLASFQRKEDAEHMKASLIMRGLDVRIKAANQSGGVWYRVVMGPFTARAQAEKVQAEIAHSEHISGIIRRMDA